MNNHEAKAGTELQEVLRAVESLRRSVRAFTVAVLLMALALLLTVAVLYGYLVDYHAGEALLQGGVAVGAALLGFGCGWLAGRWT